MSSTYNSTPLATQDIAYKPKLIEVNAQQTAEESSNGGFAETLKQVLQLGDSSATESLGQAADKLTTEEQTAKAEPKDLSLEELAPKALDLGLGLASGNPIAAGLAGTDLLQSGLKTDIEAQFTQLGQTLAAALVAGLSGNPIATAVTSSVESVGQQTALDQVKAIGEQALGAESKIAGVSDLVEAVGSKIAGVTESAEAKTAANLTGAIKTKGTIPQAILDAQAAKINQQKGIEENS
ncbi:hypothetical protein ACRRS0_08545 [Agarivorans sp. QJM3NY_29]|uniref:hypothetical protein n=1 Tax=unclassified Agarivorans TaxID=2636026 RepID=UPI003D7D01B1